MSDGVTIRADVTRPALPGHYPTVMTITGYNKGASEYGNCGAGNTALAELGYAVMTVDDRGTGASEGTWDRYGPRTRQDYGEILDWIQTQPWSNGRVGTTGESYAAGTGIMTAIEDAKRIKAGKPKAVYGVFVTLAMSDMYRDYPHVGGAVNLGFTLPWLGLVAGTSAPPPSTLPDPSALTTYLAHMQNIKDFHAQFSAGAIAGQEFAFDSDFYHQHSPGTGAETIVAPVAWTGGWFDIFQRGEVEYWNLLKSAPDKKMWMSPRYHVNLSGDVWDAQGIGTEASVVQKWWDHYLKGVNNGVEKLADVNLYEMGKNAWYHGDDWPDPTYTPYYFNTGATGSATSLVDATLSASAPTASGSDLIPFSFDSGACSKTRMQWSGGLSVGPPCETDNKIDELGAITYTTSALTNDVRIAGKVTANLWATVSTTDTFFVVKLTDVAPDGTSSQVGSGYLIGSQRALDPAKTLKLADGTVIKPYHPFTKASITPIVANQPTQFLVEVYPTANTFLKGHRIRVAITTSDNPAMVVPATYLPNMVGGQIHILHDAQHPSNILLPVITQSSAASVSPAPAPAAAPTVAAAGASRLPATGGRLLALPALALLGGAGGLRRLRKRRITAGRPRLS
jgi:putative CocE/NonD family hydrolase